MTASINPEVEIICLRNAVRDVVANVIDSVFTQYKVKPKIIFWGSRVFVYSHKYYALERTRLVYVYRETSHYMTLNNPEKILTEEIDGDEI